VPIAPCAARAARVARAQQPTQAAAAGGAAAGVCARAAHPAVATCSAWQRQRHMLCGAVAGALALAWRVVVRLCLARGRACLGGSGARLPQRTPAVHLWVSVCAAGRELRRASAGTHTHTYMCVCALSRLAAPPARPRLPRQWLQAACTLFLLPVLILPWRCWPAAASGRALLCRRSSAGPCGHCSPPFDCARARERAACA
jgi:hypothetical protein